LDPKLPLRNKNPRKTSKEKPVTASYSVGKTKQVINFSKVIVFLDHTYLSRFTLPWMVA